VLFEAPHRIAASLDDMARSFGDQRAAVVTRELTKMHESVYRGTLQQLSVMAREDADFARGEITVVVAGAAAEGASGADGALLRRALQLLLQELPPARAAAIAAQLSGATRSDAYELALQLRRGPAD
jgi:16S rRNA (cytidine1402-2'-O)-methyltransferase